MHLIYLKKNVDLSRPAQCVVDVFGALMFDVHLMGFESLINPPRPVDTPGHGKTVGAIEMRSNQIVTYFHACMCGEHAILNKFDQI